jgi:CHASE3 domain sensor protein
MNDDEKIRIDPSARLTDKKLRLSKLALNFIFIPAIIFILFISFHSYRQVNNLIHDNYWVTHTHQVIQTIDAVLYDIIDLETHQRGYLITGDSEFLADTDSVKSHLKNTLEFNTRQFFTSGAYPAVNQFD